MGRRLLICGLLGIVGLTSGTRRARAEPSSDDKALATLLFQQGRALLSAGNVAEACQKLEESQRLDPGGGTILNLALCHEQEGRFARSWSEFKEAMVIARRDGRRDREAEAANHIAALEPRLSRLTIVVPAEAQVEGLLIERDGHALGPGAWSTAIPIDGGEHSVRASALGRDPFTTTIVIAKELDARTVEIPVLATPVVVVSSSETSLSAATLPSRSPAPRAVRLRWPGIVAAGVGVVLLGGAGYVLATALKARDDSNSHCWIDGCDDAGVQQRNKAVARGDLATLLGIGGTALVATGATLLYFDRRSSASPANNGSANGSAARRPERIRARFLLGAAPGTVVTGIEGGF